MRTSIVNTSSRQCRFVALLTLLATVVVLYNLLHKSTSNEQQQQQVPFTPAAADDTQPVTRRRPTPSPPATRQLTSPPFGSPIPVVSSAADRVDVVHMDTNDMMFILQHMSFLQSSSSSAKSSSLPSDPTYVQRLKNVTVRVSQQLNDAYRRYQQARCRTPGVDFTDTGSWCERAVNQLHLTDIGIAGALADFLAGKTVASLGDGTGVYRQLIFNSTNKVLRYDAFDGAPFSEEKSNGTVRFFDLTIPQYWLPNYDWVICLEVIEHIPAEYESIVLDNIVRPAIEGVIMSWAVPTQPGARHINARDAGYGDTAMKERGMALDVEASRKLREASRFSWFRNNTAVYRRISAVKVS